MKGTAIEVVRADGVTFYVASDHIQARVTVEQFREKYDAAVMGVAS